MFLHAELQHNQKTHDLRYFPNRNHGAGEKIEGRDFKGMSKWGVIKLGSDSLGKSRNIMEDLCLPYIRFMGERNQILIRVSSKDFGHTRTCLRCQKFRDLNVWKYLYLQMYQNSRRKFIGKSQEMSQEMVEREIGAYQWNEIGSPKRLCGNSPTFLSAYEC